MTLYFTKTWGFSSPCGPLQFGQRGWMERAKAILKDGDLVAIVGTKGIETRDDERGRLLGLMEPTKVEVSALDYKLAHRQEDYDKNGRYRWPFGLEIRRAWRFPGPRMEFEAVSARQFHMEAASGIVELLPEEAAAVMALPREPVPLLRSIGAVARVEGIDAARKLSAPPPTSVRTGVMHMRRAPAFTYAMEIQGASTPAWKIGWAFDYRRREREFNHAAMPSLGGLRYRTTMYELWDSAREAFRMEQSLLNILSLRRQRDNSEIVSGLKAGELDRIWTDYLFSRPR